MGANVYPTGKSAFMFDKPYWRNGAIATSRPNLVEHLELNPQIALANRNSSKYTWLVCSHLSQPERVYRYYLASGLIAIVLGKCFCETCLDKMSSGEDLSELIRSSRPMTDKLFQDEFIRPLLGSNSDFNKISGQSSDYDLTPKNWVSCPHTSTKNSLARAYVSGGHIFIFESFFTCQDCFEKIPADSLVDLLYEGESMNDILFQKKVIESLYAINHESLSAVRHFDILQA